MRVVQIIDTLDLLGGAQKMQVAFAEAVEGMDIDLTVLTLEKESEGTALPSLLESYGVDVHYFPARKLLSPGRFWQLFKFLHSGHFDIAHTNLTYANIVGVFAAWLAGIPTIAGLRNAFNQRRRFHTIRALLESFTLKFLVRKIMAVGAATAEAHQARFPKKPIVPVPNSVVLPEPVSAAERAAIRATLLDHPERPLLISVGRLTPQKGYIDLLNAFALVQQSHAESRLIIVGDGELHGALKDQIEALGLGDSAQLLGRREDVPRLLAASDIFVSSSHWEGLSNAILEAMAAGLPLVATAVADTPNIVVPGTGLIVPPQQPNELATAMLTLLENPAQREAFGQQARLFVDRQHNPARWAKQMINLYQSVLENGRTGRKNSFAVERSES